MHRPEDPGAAKAEVARAVRQEWPKLVATLLRDFGDLGAAEDAAQDALEIALQKWDTDGIPDKPGAWITTVARRRSLDRLRRAKKGREKTELIAQLEERLTPEESVVDLDEDVLRDDQLRLMFGCCHPSLSIEAQMALTLRSLAGLTTAEIARSFLVPEATMAQRLVRAKKKISSAVIPFEIPRDAELLKRTSVVHHVLYLLFNEGYNASEGDSLVRQDLTEEAIRLAGLLASLMPDDAETLGLYAMFLLIDARRPARDVVSGELVLLEDQDRSLWITEQIQQGTHLLDRALRLERPGQYQLLAAINALHDDAAIAESTDWPQISALYQRLFELAPNPVVALNGAVAVAMAEGPQKGLDLLGALDGALDDYRYLHAARADLLRRLGDYGAAVASYQRALDLTNVGPERVFLRRRLEEMAQAIDSDLLGD